MGEVGPLEVGWGWAPFGTKAARLRYAEACYASAVRIRAGRGYVMRLLISLVLIVYLVGVGVALSPTFREKWNSAPASELAASVWVALPVALAWPMRVYHELTDRPSGAGA